MSDDSYLEAAADAYARAWSVGEPINQRELFSAVGCILMYLRFEAQEPLNAEVRAGPDGLQRFVTGLGWVDV